MKIILAKNKINASQSKRLKDVKDFFKDVFDLEFTEELINKTIFHSTYSFIDDKDGKYKYFKAVDETWYDENISKPYKVKGYEISMLLLKQKEWDGKILDAQGNVIDNRIIGGFGNMENDWGIEEIALPYDTSGLFNFNGVQLEGDKLTWTIIHELLHRIYEMKGLVDNTHKYFLEGNPYKCLEDFKQPEVKTWKYFKLKEKTGSLGHTVADLETKLVDRLDKLRELCGFPFIITSGYRTLAENLRVGGVAGSAHTKRLAVDIFCNDSEKRGIIVANAWNNGFIGIGIDTNFVHLDIDTSKPKRIFLYK